MKMKFNEVRPAKSKSYLKHKLISATAMLLISTIMMVSTSYAWYVLSTAPEVSNIKTQVGANGALEIALLNEESWENLVLLDMGDIDDSAIDPDEIECAILKSRSPTSGVKEVYDGSFSGKLVKGMGTLAAALQAMGITVIDCEDVE